MSFARNLAGFKFGKLTAIKKHSKDNANRWNWLCECECGNNKVIASRHLVNNKTSSCGCLKIITAISNGKNSSHKISGEKSYLYDKSITDFERINRRNSEITKIKSWRNNIYLRDNYTCDICRKKGGKLEAHHLNSWSIFKDLRFELNNGITLCKECHFNFHQSLGGCRKKCTNLDYMNFKAKWYLEHELDKFNG
jgi:5-methylcytosine-specific restriction endonuclease McrA